VEWAPQSAEAGCNRGIGGVSGSLYPAKNHFMQHQLASFAKYASAVHLTRRQGAYYANLAKH